MSHGILKILRPPGVGSLYDIFGNADTTLSWVLTEAPVADWRTDPCLYGRLVISSLATTTVKNRP
jgi:hypothetical protein